MNFPKGDDRPSTPWEVFLLIVTWPIGWIMVGGFVAMFLYGAYVILAPFSLIILCWFFGWLVTRKGK